VTPFDSRMGQTAECEGDAHLRSAGRQIGTLKLTLLPAVADWMGGRDFSGLPPINGPACLVSLAGGAVLASCCWT
jgi:hypothetical protein